LTIGPDRSRSVKERIRKSFMPELPDIAALEALKRR
jgi:hypothetical protein